MSTSTATVPPQPPATSESTQQSQQYRLPTDVTLKHCAKLAIVEDKPILLDYWSSSLDKKALVGVKESGEKLLVKSEEEYTSPIKKFLVNFITLEHNQKLISILELLNLQIK